MEHEKLLSYVGKKVRITFFDDDVMTGVLGFASSFGAKYGYRKVHCFYIDNLCFRCSHVKKLEEVE